MYMKKHRLLGVLAALLLVSTLTPAAWAAEVPAKSTNKGAHEYINGRRWSKPVQSYLYENASGGLTRVEYIDGAVIVEDYDASFGLVSSRTVQAELPIWGGFFAGEDYNFLVFGQENVEEDNNKEVVRIVKYGKDWTRLGQASLRGANTIAPFASGAVRCAEEGGMLYIHTCHQMYTSEDGLNHQASMSILLRQRDMAITDSSYEVGGPAYVSHSFNQFILIDRDKDIVALDHGDAYPRSVVLQKLIAKAGQESFREEKRVPAERPGWYYTKFEDTVDVIALPTAASHYNDTGCAVGGFAETSRGYVTAYQFEDTGAYLGENSRDLYLAMTDRDLNDTTTVRVTSGVNVSNPQLASMGPEGGYLLWNTVEQKNWYTTSFGNTLCYAPYDAGGAVGQVQMAEGTLSDCQPICWQGKAVWYTTDGSAPVFYTLDGSGLKAVSASTATKAPDPKPASNVAHASTQRVLVDGRSVEFQAYALWDENGNPSNYVKLRDLAYVLSDTDARFEVAWNGGVILTTKTPYTAVGGEMTTPYSGDQPYTAVLDPASVDGVQIFLDAFVIHDSQGGGYTYYKLRDLGSALGFKVDWSAEQGILINTR